MTTPYGAADIKAAQEVADLIKAGNTKEAGVALANEYVRLDKGTAWFDDFLKQVKQDNADDLKSNSHLPGIEFGPDTDGNLRVNVTTPGHVSGNLWRDRDEIFAAITTKSETVGDVGGKDKSGNETAVAAYGSTLHTHGHVGVIAEDQSTVHAESGAEVVALKGSFVHTAVGDSREKLRVTAFDGSTVRAGSGSEVIAEAGSAVYAREYAQVTARDGSRVEAGDQSHVTAEYGSLVLASNQSQVTAENGSLVLVRQNSQVLAKAGSHIFSDDTTKVNLQPGAELLSGEQFQNLLEKLDNRTKSSNDRHMDKSD
jgi:hypothetical protein